MEHGCGPFRSPVLTGAAVERFFAQWRHTYAMPFYKVTYAKRFNSEGEEPDRPESFADFSDGVVLNAAKAEVIEPAGLHSSGSHGRR